MAILPLPCVYTHSDLTDLLALFLSGGDDDPVEVDTAMEQDSGPDDAATSDQLATLQDILRGFSQQRASSSQSTFPPSQTPPFSFSSDHSNLALIWSRRLCTDRHPDAFEPASSDARRAL